MLHFYKKILILKKKFLWPNNLNGIARNFFVVSLTASDWDKKRNSLRRFYLVFSLELPFKGFILDI